MAIAQSRLTAQGQVSVPASVRKILGLSPGSLIEWEDDDGKIMIRRAGKFSSEDIHQAVFGDRKPKRRTLAELKSGIEKHIRQRHARDRH